MLGNENQCSFRDCNKPSMMWAIFCEQHQKEVYD